MARKVTAASVLGATFDDMDYLEELEDDIRKFRAALAQKREKFHRGEINPGCERAFKNDIADLVWKIWDNEKSRELIMDRIKGVMGPDVFGDLNEMD